MSEVREFLIGFITDELELPAEEVNDFSELVGDLGFDSLSFALGVSEIKNRFGVVLTKDDVFECKTVGALVELVENRTLLGQS
ncbi:MULTISPECIES: acyl carrier protein [Mycolicibacterium]|uniref:acyl carrier protein n=1 Tax=Mycolicibacterium TaxID=1866885 RepID=UPI001CDC9B3C|nr:phosphopantetheine-binding protein [Mycolicibacterium fortuitum]UBV14477.1 acyl carrier protein [Mycolicibacterium fortuitum]